MTVLFILKMLWLLIIILDVFTILLKYVINWPKLEKHIEVDWIFAWYDFWVGLYWDRKNKTLYIFPIPCIGNKIVFKWLIKKEEE